MECQSLGQAGRPVDGRGGLMASLCPLVSVKSFLLKTSVIPKEILGGRRKEFLSREIKAMVSLS